MPQVPFLFWSSEGEITCPKNVTNEYLINHFNMNKIAKRSGYTIYRVVSHKHLF